MVLLIGQFSMQSGGQNLAKPLGNLEMNSAYVLQICTHRVYNYVFSAIQHRNQTKSVTCGSLFYCIYLNIILAATLRWFTAGVAIRIALRQFSQTWKLRHYDVIDDVIIRKL